MANVRPGQSFVATEQVHQRTAPRERKAGAFGMAVAIVLVLAACDGVAGAAAEQDAINHAAESQVPSPTGPVVTGPTEPSNVGLSSFLPEDAKPITPEPGKHGKLVLSERDSYTGGVMWQVVHVYADGRVIWNRRTGGVSTTTRVWLERRLTPKGIEILRSGAVPLSSRMESGGSSAAAHGMHPPGSLLPAPASTWEDPEFERYVPSRYAVCAGQAASVWFLLPQRAREVLSGIEQGYVRRCLAVTAGEARVLFGIFDAVGFERSKGFGQVTYGVEERGPRITFLPILPNGTFKRCRCP
jgi:hypothetical protein